VPAAGFHAHATEVIPMKLPYTTLNVFTDKRFTGAALATGNPLAVVFDADELDGDRMQAIARESNYPETVFVLKPKASSSTARVRIFAPGTELPFAGHPTVGTALMLALKGHGDDGTIVLEEKIGVIRCTVAPDGNTGGHAKFLLPDLPRGAGTAPTAGAIAAALGLSVNDIGFDRFVPARWSVGNAFTFVPVRDLDTIRRCKINEAAWDQAFEVGGRTSAFVFCGETVDPENDFHARMFAPRLGIAEDPATGSAVAAFAGLCVRTLFPDEGEYRYVIEQGYEMGRPSLIELTLTMRGGTLRLATIGGNAVIVGEGTIEV
jgi:trans-2,3-dihydro-3-hydroxyanthranilate isomerase